MINDFSFLVPSCFQSDEIWDSNSYVIFTISSHFQSDGFNFQLDGTYTKLWNQNKFVLLIRMYTWFLDHVKEDCLISRRKEAKRFPSSLKYHRYPWRRDDSVFQSFSPRHQRARRVLATEIEASSARERWSVR